MTHALLHGPWVGPALGLLVVVAEGRYRRRKARLMAALGAEGRCCRHGVETALVVVAALLMGWALDGSGGTYPAAGVSSGVRDVVLVMDVSRSMSVRDVEPDRGAVARLAALRIATGAETARVGVAAFASEGYLLLPPTSDRGLVSLYVESLDPGVVSGQGSNLGHAVGVAVDAVSDPSRSGVVVLFSDGEGFDEPGELDAAVTAARRRGVPVHTVMVGTGEGAPVPGVPGSPRSVARPETLRRIAEGTGGVAVRAADGAAVARLAASLGKVADSAPAPARSPFAPVAPVHWLALGALVALLAESAWGARRAA